MNATRYCVVQYRHGKFDGIMSGMGKNRGTLDSDHSRRSAQRHARMLRMDNVNEWRTRAGLSYRVETET
jgi:putative IMPACT (imprinted ancient) family translation regulator